ncbi:type IV secretory system conjugative DNA transfer family protein [Luteibacter sp.]|jgi:type IV secretion system protein VirD4|uniref:type IV secretory system conjugative DNA transfer family protein n=1 Tax=Luteibacter sp. TaxID=1886636 RepID=UPI002F4213EF
MSHNASAPSWVKATLAIGLVAAAVPAWMYLAGYVFTLILFRKAAHDIDLRTWFDYYGAYGTVPGVRKPLMIGAGAATLALLIPLALAFVKPRQSLHGTARFARASDMRRHGLLTNQGDGVILGRHGKRFLTASLQQLPHIMLAAPTGSGKGVGIVIPNLLNWNHSAVVLDIKKENWTLTAGFRKANGHEVYLFDPASPERHTHRWNPLAYIRDDPGLIVDDIQKIGNIIFPDVPGTDPLWTASCRSLFLGMVLYVFETEGKPRTLGQVAREAMQGSDENLTALIDYRQRSDKPLSLVCSSSLKDYINTADNTRTSIRKTFTSRFELFLNPILDAATADNDFDIRALRERRITVYIGITPDNLSRLAPLLNLFFQQVVDINTRELPEHNPALKYQCLLILDEFRSLGKLQIVVDAIAFLRGYGLRLLPIFQSPSQVREVYGEDAARNFFQNHAVRICYTPADMDVATEISREMGNFTVNVKSVSHSGGLGQARSRSVNFSEQSRALMLPQEVKDITQDEELIFARGCPAIKATKIRWYQEETFKSRVQPVPQVPTAPLPAIEAIVYPESLSGEEESDQNGPGEDIPDDDPVSGEEADRIADAFYAELARVDIESESSGDPPAAPAPDAASSYLEAFTVDERRSTARAHPVLEEAFLLEDAIAGTASGQLPEDAYRRFMERIRTHIATDLASGRVLPDVSRVEAVIGGE